MTSSKPFAASAPVARLEDKPSFGAIQDFITSAEFTAARAEAVDMVRNRGIVAAQIPQELASGDIENVVKAYIPREHHGYHVTGQGDERSLVMHAQDLEALRSHLDRGLRTQPEPKAPITAGMNSGRAR